MNVLAVNGGSTSFKIETYALDPAALAPLAEPPEPKARVEPDRDGLEAALRSLLPGADVVAHRVVRMPQPYEACARLDDAVRAAITALDGDTPLHNAQAIAVVALVARLAPTIAQIAVGDAAFHRTLSPAARMYAVPKAIADRGYERIGYHGLSHEYASARGAALAGLDVRRARIVTMHLGGGSSACAVANGASIDTSMGFTPLDGIPMATRSGAIDPGILLDLLRTGTSLDALTRMLSRESGLAGMGGHGGDVRALLASEAAGDADAKRALDVLAFRGRTTLGACIAALGGVDAIVFTGGIGEHAPAIRERILAPLAGMGIALDRARNAAVGEGPIGVAGATPALVVVPSRENWNIARTVAARFPLPEMLSA